MEALIRIQKELKVLKDQKAAYYNFRSAECIYAAVKPFLQTAILTCSDTIVSLPPRFYLKATATLKEGPVSESCDGWAREQDTKKGLEAAQVTGGCSSYARKYALCGLFLIDNGLDPDAQTTPVENAPSEDSKWTPTTGPGQQPAAQQTKPAAAAPQGQIPAPTPAERTWLRGLWEWYVGQSQGRLQMENAKPMQKMMSLSQMHLGRYPNSMNDVEQLKGTAQKPGWIKIEELIG